MNDCYKFELEQYEEKKATMTKDQLNSKQMKCFNNYQEKLKDMVPQINLMYEGYINNFDKRTGKIIDINQIMKDKKIYQSVKEQTDAVEKMGLQNSKGGKSDIL